MKKAFTLAEVLITLAIIGIVAAMTIPSLVQSYKKRVVETKLQKAYAEVQQALRMAVAEHGDYESWDYGTAFDGASAEKILNTYLVPYLKITKNCGASSGCLSGDVYSLDGIAHTYAYGDSSPRTAKALTASGYAIGVTSGGDYVTYEIAFNNPKSDKLIMGKDIFFLSIGRDMDQDLSYDADSDDSEYRCSKNGTATSGVTCLALILNNGWEIPDDYPVKF